MPINRALVAACIACLLIGMPASGAATRFDGHFWRQSDPSTRQLFVYSFLNGIVQGQDRVARKLLMTSGGGSFRPECHEAVSKNINRLETGLGKLNRGQFMNALDAFYEVRSNRAVELKWAVLVILQQLEGAPAVENEREAEVSPPP
jgi:hypothetical protein